MDPKGDVTQVGQYFDLFSAFRVDKMLPDTDLREVKMRRRKAREAKRK